MRVPFAGGAYRGVSPAANAQKCVNFYLENDLNDLDGQGNPKKLLIGTPGLHLFSTMPNNGVIRGMHAYNKGSGTLLLFVVSGNKLYEVDTLGTTINERGTFDTSTGPVFMDDNGANYGNQIIITDGTSGYIWNTSTSTFTKITDSNFFASPGPVLQMNSWFVCCNKSSKENFRLSKLGDGLTWTPLQEATADSEYDGLIGLAKDGNKLLLFGSETIEMWWNTGNADFPFQRMGDGVFYNGCLAASSIARAGGLITWLGCDARGQLQVLTFSGAPTVISTPDIEWQLSKLSTVTDAVAYGYHATGHDFYVLTFPTADVTFVYDFTTKEWHQRSTNTSGTTYHRHSSNCYAFFNNKHYVGHYLATGKIYQMDSSYFSDDGTTIIRDRIGIHFNKDNERVRLRRAGFVFGGDGAQSGVASTATLQWSKDRGFAYSTARVADHVADGMGYWEQLGLARDFVFWLRCSSATEQCVVTDSILDVVGG